MKKSTVIQKTKTSVSSQISTSSIKNPSTALKKSVTKIINTKSKSIKTKIDTKAFIIEKMKELERERFKQAKLRLRNYVLSGSQNENEQHRILSYFKHRYSTFISIMKEVNRAKKVMKAKILPVLKDNEESGNKVFGLNPLVELIKASSTMTAEECER